MPSLRKASKKMDEETVDIPQNASVEHQADAQDAQIEAEALKMGWKPKEKFTGPEGKWVDAKTYVERGEQILPIVQSQLRKTREELAEVRKAAQEWTELQKAAQEREVSEWKAKFEQAVKDKAEAISKGDGEAAVEAEARQEELKANRPETPKKETRAEPDPLFSSGCTRTTGSTRTSDARTSLLGSACVSRSKDSRVRSSTRS